MKDRIGKRLSTSVTFSPGDAIPHIPCQHPLPTCTTIPDSGLPGVHSCPLPSTPTLRQSIVKPPNLIRPLLRKAPQRCPLIIDTINNPSHCLVPSSCTSSQQLLAQLLPFPPVLCSPTTPISFPLLHCNLYSGKSYAWKCPHPPVPLPVSLYLCCNLPITDWSLWRNLP